MYIYFILSLMLPLFIVIKDSGFASKSLGFAAYSLGF